MSLFLIIAALLTLGAKKILGPGVDSTAATPGDQRPAAPAAVKP
jgi:hypothetical protein